MDEDEASSAGSSFSSDGEEDEEPTVEAAQSLKGTKRLREEEEDDEDEEEDYDEDDEEARHGKGDYDEEPLDKRKWMTEEQAAACKKKYEEWRGSLRGHADELAHLSKALGLSAVQVEKRFHYLRKLEKRQKNSKRGHTDANLQVLENLQDAEEVPSSPGGHSTSDTRKTKQARLTKEQADALQVKYREWGGSLKNKSRHVHALANKLDLTVAQIDKRFRYLRKKGRAAQRRKKGKGKKKDKSAPSPEKETGAGPSASILSGISGSMSSGGISASLLGAVALTKARRTGQSAAAQPSTGNSSIMDQQFQMLRQLAYDAGAQNRIRSQEQEQANVEQQRNMPRNASGSSARDQPHLLSLSFWGHAGGPLKEYIASIHQQIQTVWSDEHVVRSYPEHLQAAALRRLESNLHEEMETDRIVHFLMMVAGRFTINHEPVFARLGRAQAPKLDNGRLCRGPLPRHIIRGAYPIHALQGGRLDYLAEADVSWFRASNLMEPLAVFQIEKRSSPGLGVVQLIDAALSGCQAPVFLIIPKGQQAASAATVRSPWLRLLASMSNTVSSIRVVLEESIEEVVADENILLRFADNLISFLQLISKPLSSGL